jgi:hypothetical protein
MEVEYLLRVDDRGIYFTMRKKGDAASTEVFPGTKKWAQPEIGP